MQNKYINDNTPLKMHFEHFVCIFCTFLISIIAFATALFNLYLKIF